MEEDSKNPWEAKQAARRDHYLERAEAARQEAQRAEAQARRISDMIPLGQPILIGHHSEARHRRDIERINNGYRKAHEASEKAEHYESKAQGVGSGGISSDDPEAVRKLKAELASVEALQAKMKATNAALCKPREEGDTMLRDLGLTDDEILKLRQPDCMGGIGFASWQLKNNGANARRIKKRIEQLKAKAGDETTERILGDVRMVDNVEANRLQLFFPGKPSVEVRKSLKGHGFRWSPREGAWQTFRSSRATWAASRILGVQLDQAQPHADGAFVGACVLPPGADPDDCTTHDHEEYGAPPAPISAGPGTDRQVVRHEGGHHE